MGVLTRAVEQIYERRRDHAQRLAEEHRAEAFQRIPALERLETEMIEASMSFLRRTLRHAENPPDPSELESFLDSLKKKRSELLVAGGYPEDWLAPQWTCGICSDTGYSDLATHTLCDCSRQLLIEGRYGSSNLLRDGQTGFDCFRENWYPAEPNPSRYGTDQSPRTWMCALRDHLIDWAAGFDRPESRNLYLFGSTGTGKTFLAKSVGLKLLETGHSVLYISAPTLFDAIRACKFAEPDDLESQREYRRFAQSDLLIIDDLGTEPASDARFADLLMLLEERTRSSSRVRRTIISTNLDIKRLYVSYNERIGSRIAGEFDILRCIGEDIRLEKKKAVGS